MPGRDFNLTMPIPKKTQVYNQIWSLLEASSDFTSVFSSRRRIKATSLDSWAKAATYFALSDLPNIRIFPGRYVSSGFKNANTFAGEQATFLTEGGQWVLERTAEFGIEIIASSLVLGGDKSIDTLTDICELALLRGGPRLGLDFVRRWGNTTVSMKIAKDNDSEAVRAIASIGFPVIMEMEGRDELGI